MTTWKTEDFETLSWHDVHAHGFRIVDVDKNSGFCDLILDIDYIQYWHREYEHIEFTICPAELRFREIFKLKLSLDYASMTAGISPFSIETIERTPLEFPDGEKSFSWRISLNWPDGEISFEAPGFTLEITGKSLTSKQPWIARK